VKNEDEKMTKNNPKKEKTTMISSVLSIKHQPDPDINAKRKHTEENQEREREKKERWRERDRARERDESEEFYRRCSRIHRLTNSGDELN